jgi:hypothetical protein
MSLVAQVKALREFFGLVQGNLVQDLKEMKEPAYVWRPSEKKSLRLRRALSLSISYGRPRLRKPVSYGRPRRPKAASFLIREEGLALYGFLDV